MRSGSHFQQLMCLVILSSVRVGVSELLSTITGLTRADSQDPTGTELARCTENLECSCGEAGERVIICKGAHKLNI